MRSSPAFLDASALDDLHQHRDDRKHDEDVNLCPDHFTEFE